MLKLAKTQTHILSLGNTHGSLGVSVLTTLCKFEYSNHTANQRWGIGGERPEVDSEKIDKALSLYRAQTHTINEIVEITGVSQGSLYNA